MSRLFERSWLRRLGLTLAAFLCLGVMTAGSKPADARVWVSIGVPGPFYYAPVYYPYYYPYRPYWRAHWRGRHWHWCRWHPYACGW